MKPQQTAKPTGIELSVCEDIADRQQMGIAKYGQTVADNPLLLKQWLQHAYEEALDLSVYLKRAMLELPQTIPTGLAMHWPQVKCGNDRCPWQGDWDDLPQRSAKTPQNGRTTQPATVSVCPFCGCSEFCYIDPPKLKRARTPPPETVTCCDRQHPIIQWSYKVPEQYGAECTQCGKRLTDESPEDLVQAFTDFTSMKDQKAPTGKPPTVL